jgi:pre-rRNA-processing protein TSR4
MNLQELESSLLEAGYAAAGNRNHHHHHHHRGNQGDDGGSDSGEATTSNHTISESFLPSLPCFYVYTQSEESTPYESATTRSENPADGEVNDSLNEIEDPYGIVEGVGELWEGEEYEPEQAIFADRTYLKFKKKLDISPEQCFRYSFGGRPLWATDAHDEPGTCGACGGPRVYEMQLMPPVLYFLQQAYKDLPPSEYGPNDWDWSTLVVYSCAQSCLQRAPDRAMIAGERTDWSIIVEGTILQAEVVS